MILLNHNYNSDLSINTELCSNDKVNDVIIVNDNKDIKIIFSFLVYNCLFSSLYISVYCICFYYCIMQLK